METEEFRNLSFEIDDELGLVFFFFFFFARCTGQILCLSLSAGEREGGDEV